MRRFPYRDVSESWHTATEPPSGGFLVAVVESGAFSYQRNAMRFSLLTLLCITTIVAAGFSIVLTVPVPWLAGWISMGCLWILLGATLGIMHSNGQRRAFWVGFAIFGWGNITAFSAFWHILPTYAVVEYVRSLGPLPVRTSTFGDRQVFHLAGHCLWSLIFGGLGGMLNCYLWSLYERRSRMDARSENPSSN